MLLVCNENNRNVLKLHRLTLVCISAVLMSKHENMLNGFLCVYLYGYGYASGSILFSEFI